MFLVRSTWDDAGDPEMVQEFDRYTEARRAGLGLSCLAGVVTVVVEGPDGVENTYSRVDNVWRSPGVLAAKVEHELLLQDEAELRRLTTQ